ncbi:MAG: FtsX-like permease family protein [Aggregatilineales bacterium]
MIFKQLTFYLRYAARNLRRSGRWTIFAVFCIAAGVATVVALRSLGLAIADSLVDNVRANNHGDITISQSGFAAGGVIVPFSARELDTFAPQQLQQLQQWAQERGARISAYLRATNLQVTAVDFVSVGRPQFISALLIDPATFPPTEDIFALDPPGTPLSELFTGGNDIVISRNLADAQGLGVGDTARVSGTTDLYTVRGIVPTEAEASISDLFASFFGFVYLDIAQAENLQLPSLPNVVSIALPPEVDINAAEQELRSIPISGFYTTVPNLLERNEFIGDVLGRFIVIMGLGALLIGGVGIINTMLVMVGRRTTEIAALKTFGLKGRQVAALFLAEAFLLGVMGSIVGTAIGLLLSGVVNQYGETFLQQRLIWRFYPEAALFGLGIGVVVSLVFGVLPVLVANRVRPATILRPNETEIPAAGCLQSLIALALVILVIGGIAGQILGSIPAGMIGVAITLAILGLLVGLLWIVVWLVGKLPAFGLVDVRLALRNLTTRRMRTATTLLALSAGMFALSSITFVGAGTREILQFQLTQNLGGNVLVFPLVGLVSQGLGQGLLDAQLRGIEGITYRTRISTYSGRLLAIDGKTPPPPDLPVDLSPRALQQFTRVQVQERQSDNPALTSGTILAGRDLTSEDAGRPYIVVAESSFSNNYNLSIGSILTMQFSGREVDLEVIGIANAPGGFNTGQYFVAPGALPVRPDFQFNVLQVEPDSLNMVLLRLSENPLVFALDITFIDGLLRRLIDQFSAIPTVVGLLSLLAAAVAMANTVSLSTLERRRQIGIMKAIGLKGRRVLRIMLLENTLVGLLGGALGIGLSALGVALMTELGQGIAIPIPRDAVPFALALIAAAVLIAWAATFLSARPAIRERVLNVLRYE